MLYKASKQAEKVAKRSLTVDVIIVYILCFKHVDFIGESVSFNEEMSHFKCEQMHEIVHASCLNINGSKVQSK